MCEEFSSPTRRSVLATTATAGAPGLATSAWADILGSAQAEGAASGNPIRLFRVDFLGRNSPNCAEA